MMSGGERSPAKKIRIFCRFFTGLRNVYGTYDMRTGRVRQVKEPVTDNVIRAHLAGERPYGVYLLNGDRIKSLAVDFDKDELGLPVEFVARTKHYGFQSYIERSKSKGYHTWIFFERGGVQACKARAIAQMILHDIGAEETEIFPKQDSLVGQVSYGNFINAPLFGELVCAGRTVFVDPEDPRKIYPDQWDLLDRVERASAKQLDDIIALNQPMQAARKNNAPSVNRDRLLNHKAISFGLPICARKMLAEGVHAYQRVACFRLANHLRRSGIPYDLALVMLKAWSRKNRPNDGKPIIACREVESQTRYAYRRSYRSFGCEEPAVAEYCDKKCPLYRRVRAHR